MENANPEVAVDGEKAEPIIDDVELRSTTALMRYYNDAVKFCMMLKSAGPTLNELLSSNVKGEVVEVMNLFVVAFNRGMEFAEVLSSPLCFYSFQ